MKRFKQRGAGLAMALGLFAAMANAGETVSSAAGGWFAADARAVKDTTLEGGVIVAGETNLVLQCSASAWGAAADGADVTVAYSNATTGDAGTIAEKTTAETVDWTPNGPGTFVLTHTVATGGDPVVLSATFAVPGVTFTPATIDHTTAAVYTNGVEIVKTGDAYLISSNATATVVYTTEGDYVFAGGTKVVTNALDTAKNPATVAGDLPKVLDSVKYTAPTYVDNIASNGIAHWTTNTLYSYTVVTSAASRVTWGESGATSWYVVTNGTFQIDGGVECVGDVHLVLCDGAKLTVTNVGNNAGIEADNTTASFSVYGTPDGAGEFSAFGGLGGAGIGSRVSTGQNITINGGTVTAVGGENGAGIGGGSGIGMNIVINGGTVTATGGERAAGIGGGGYNKKGTGIVINGGVVCATGGPVHHQGFFGGAGIGGSFSGVGEDITINGGTVTATGGEQAAAIGGGGDADGKSIAIKGGVVRVRGFPGAGAGIGGGYMGDGKNISLCGGEIYVTSPMLLDGDGVFGFADCIGSGSGDTAGSEEIVISSTSKICFNLTGIVDEDLAVVEPMAAMPETIDGFVIMTPETQTVDRVLVSGCGAVGGGGAAETWALTNAVTGATGTIAVNGAHVDFAGTYLNLTDADGKLTLALDEPTLTISEQPTSANDYTIVATTDGSEGITNYAWCAFSDRTIGFDVLTNALEAVKDECAFGGYEGNSIKSFDSEDEGSMLQVFWCPEDNPRGVPGIPEGGKLYFTCTADISTNEEMQEELGSIHRIGETDEWVWDAKLVDFTGEGTDYVYFLLLFADSPFSIENPRWVVNDYTPVAEGATLTQFPTDKGVGGSTYVCRVTYGHRGTYYTADSETFVYQASTTYPAYVASLPDAMKQKFDTWATTFGSRDPDGVYTNAFLLNVATNDEAKAIAAFKITSIVATNENDGAVAEVGKPVPLSPSTFFNGELWYQAATNLAADAVWTDLVEGSYTWDTNTFFRAKLDLTHPDAPTVPTTSEAGRSVKFRSVE